MTRRIEPAFFNMTQRIEPAFFNMTQRIELFLKLTKSFFNGLEESNPFFQYDSTNRTFLKCDSFFKMIQRTEPLFGKITQRIGLDSKTWTLCFSNLIPRIGLILMTPRLEASFLNYVTKNFFLKKNDSKNWTKIFDSKICFFCMAQRNDFFVWLKELIFLYDPKNWNLFLWIWRRELKLFSLNMTQRIEPFFFFTAKNWNFFFFAANDWVFFFKILLTQRIELFCLIWLKEMKSEKNDSKSWTCFFDMTYRIEPLLFSLIWLKELNFVSKKETQKIEIFFFNNDSKDWTLCKRLIELSLFFEPLLNLSCFFTDSKNWTFFECNSKIFLSVTKRIEPSSFWSVTQRIDFF